MAPTRLTRVGPNVCNVLLVRSCLVKATQRVLPVLVALFKMSRASRLATRVRVANIPRLQEALYVQTVMQANTKARQVKPNAFPVNMDDSKSSPDLRTARTAR
jgi:hypothetical protein